MLVRHVIERKSRAIILAKPRTPVIEAMRLLIQNQISCLPVVDDSGELLGIVSDKDIFAAIYQDQDGFMENTVGELMTTDVIVALPDDNLNYLANIMTTNLVRHIPIVDQSRLVGLVSLGDIVKAQMIDMEVENRYLKEYIAGAYPG